MHALVFLAPSGPTPADDELQAEHERFIDGLDRAGQVVTGGSLRPATERLEGAYLLRCESLEEARRSRTPIRWSVRAPFAARCWSGCSSLSIPTPLTERLCSTRDAGPAMTTLTPRPSPRTVTRGSA